MKPPAGAKWHSDAITLAVALGTVILLVATPLYIYVRPAFVESQYRRAAFPPSERFDAAERSRLSRTLVEYLRHRASYEDMSELRTYAGEPAMLPSELSHMADVRRVMDGFFWAQRLALLALLAGSWALWRAERLAYFTAGVRRGVLFTVALMGLVLVSAAVNFDQFFDTFHRLFFKGGTWVFYYEDTLIQLYPLPLWVTAVTAVAVTILALAAAFYALAAWGDRRLVKRP